MKRIITFIVSTAVIAFAITGCSYGTDVVRNDVTNETGEIYGKIERISSDLGYDPVTHIVYRSNLTSYSFFVYIPYIAPNGLPYKYDTEKKELVEIEN